MPAKKLNLSSEVKARLRQAVLGGISSAAESSKAKLTPKPAVKTQESSLYKPKPAAKTLKKIVINAQEQKNGRKPLLLEYKTGPAKSQPAIKILAENKTDKKNMADLKSKAAVAPLKSSSVIAAPKKAAGRQTKLKIQKVKSTKPVKSVSPKYAKAVKAPLKPTIVKTEKLVPPFSVPPQKIKPVGYKPFATVKRDWEKPQKEESLEKLFTGSTKRKTAAKDTFWKFSSDAKPANAKKHIWLKLIGVIILLAVLLAGYMILGIYKYGFNDAISVQAAKVLDLPAGNVNNTGISAGAYLDSLKLLAQPLAMNREGLVDYSGKSDLSDRIFYRLAANELIAEKLRSYNKTPSQQDLDNQVAMLLKQTGGQAQADKIIQNLYGLTFDQFKNLVLLPMLQRTDLQAAIIADDSLPITQAARNKANEVLKLASVSTTDFAILAKQYTDDEASVNTGGDLGWVVKGQLDPAWENLIFTAATGTVITQPIRSDFGFHIVKVEQKLIDKTTGAESVKLRHILIKVDVDKYIKDLLDSAKIVKYIN